MHPKEYSMPPMHPVILLLVDADPEQAQSLERALRQLHIINDLRVLTTGEEAVTYLCGEQGQADALRPASLVLLLNVSLPGLNGYQVLERVKTDEQTKDIPVIMLSAGDVPVDIVRCEALGCTSYLTTPVQPEAFVEAMRQLGLFLSVVSAPPPQEHRGPL
jgi:CheY-like chemotaxis protein